MIVRILGEGQYDVADDALARLNCLDNDLECAVEAGDEAAFAAALTALLDGVRARRAPPTTPTRSTSPTSSCRRPTRASTRSASCWATTV